MMSERPQNLHQEDGRPKVCERLTHYTQDKQIMNLIIGLDDQSSGRLACHVLV